MKILRYTFVAALAVAMSGGNNLLSMTSGVSSKASVSMSDNKAATAPVSTALQGTLSQPVVATDVIGQVKDAAHAVGNAVDRLRTRWGLGAAACALAALHLGCSYYSCLTIPSYYYQASQCPRELDYRYQTSVLDWAPALVTKLAVWGVVTWLLWHKAGKVVAARNNAKAA